MTPQQRSAFAERILREAYEERERLLAGIKEQLAEVDRVIATFGGELLEVELGEDYEPPHPPPPPEPEPEPEPEPTVEDIPIEEPAVEEPVEEAPPPPPPTMPAREAKSASRAQVMRMMQALNGTPTAPDILDKVRKEDPSVTTVSDTLRKAANDELISRLEDRDEEGFPRWRLTGKGKRWTGTMGRPPKGRKEPEVKEVRDSGPEVYPAHLRKMPAANTGHHAVKQQLPAAEEQYSILSALADLGGVAVAKMVLMQLGYDRDDKIADSRLKKHFKQLRAAGLVREGDKVWAPWQQEIRAQGKLAGRQSVEQVITDEGWEALGRVPVEEIIPDEEPEPVPPTQEAPPGEEEPLTLENVRNRAVRMEGMFSPAQVAEGTSWSLDGVKSMLDMLVPQGTLQDKSPGPDLALYEYQRATGPGKAAEMDMKAKPGERGLGGGGGGRGAPVPGTGKGLVVQHAEVRRLVQDVEKAIGRDKVSRAGDGHIAVETPVGRRILISSTPSKSRSVENDRARLKRFGVQV